MTSGMVSSSSLPDRPNRRRGFGRGETLVGWSSVTDTISAYAVSNACNRTREYPSSAIRQLSKSAIADLDREPPSSQGKTPQALRYSRELRRFEGRRMRQMAVSGQIDENGSLPYKPRQLSAMTRSDRGGSFWAGNGPLWPANISRLTSLIRQIARSAENSREADLSTQQTGAQAPTRLPRPHCDDRRPQGPRRPPRPGPQASERLSRASRRFHHGPVKAAGGFPRRCQWRPGHQRGLRGAKPAPRR